MHEVQTAVRPHRAFKTAGVQSCLFGSVNHGVVRGSLLLYALLYVGVCLAFALFTYRIGKAWRAARRLPVA